MPVVNNKVSCIQKFVKKVNLMSSVFITKTKQRDTENLELMDIFITLPVGMVT